MEREEFMGRLQDKVAIVSGAGRGLGRGYARELAREGASVVIAELDPITANDIQICVTNQTDIHGINASNPKWTYRAFRIWRVHSR